MKLKCDFHEIYEFANRIGDVAKFKNACENMTQEIAKVLHQMLINETPVKTGKLRTGWSSSDNYTYKVTKVKGGYEVELKNEVPYALHVNDGHYSYNQYNVGGAPYVVKNRTVPYTQGNSDATFVFGHFFVEKSILKLENSDKLQQILYKELEKWFRWCVNGK